MPSSARYGSLLDLHSFPTRRSSDLDLLVATQEERTGRVNDIADHVAYFFIGLRYDAPAQTVVVRLPKLMSTLIHAPIQVAVEQPMTLAGVEELVDGYVFAGVREKRPRNAGVIRIKNRRRCSLAAAFHDNVRSRRQRSQHDDGPVVRRPHLWDQVRTERFGRVRSGRAS